MCAPMNFPVDASLSLMEEGKGIGGKGQQRRLFLFFEELPHLPAGRAVNAVVGDPCFPVEQMEVLLLQAMEDVSLEAVCADAGNSALTLLLWRGI